MNRNITIGKYAGSGFIYTLLCHTNVTFEDFSINNVIFNAEVSFLGLSSSSSSYYDTRNNQTALIIRNGTIQNMFETPKSTLSSEGNSLFVQSNAPTILKVHNLSVTNCIFSNMSMITFASVTNQAYNIWEVLPFVEFSDITMKYTRNANFIVNFADTVNISNVYLEGLSTKDVMISRSLFWFTTGYLMNVYNITAHNVTGPLFSTTDVLAHNFSTLSLNNMSTSQKLFTTLQGIIYVSKVNSFGKTGLDPRRPQDTFFDNINLNGYTLIDGIGNAKSANNSLVISVHTVFGKVNLTNSVWYNNHLTGFYSGVMTYFEVDNLTIDNDPGIPRKQILPHKGLYLVSAREIVFKNSVFRNNQNFILFQYSNTPIISTSEAIIQTYLTFENITVRNNSAVFDDAGTQFPSLFLIYSPRRPLNAWFRNSLFEKNINLNGLINPFESYQANIDFTNNTFDNNYATQAGAVFSSSNMRQKTSTLSFTNNTFINNRCDQNGGVFSFILTDYSMHSVNNKYFNNTARLSGGVGSAFRASFVFHEEEGAYLNNSAGSLGGAWYISLSTYNTNLQSLKFSQTSFVNSLAQQKGGSIYLENGGITLSQSTFHASQAVVAGGDLYILLGKSVNIIDTNLTASSAPEGSFLYAEDTSGITIKNAQMRDIFSQGSILAASGGSLKIKDSEFGNINSSLLLLSDVTTEINNATFNKIYCPKSSDSFCILKVTSSNTVQMMNSSIANIYSNVDIISLSDCNQVLLSNLKVQNMLKITQESLNQIFVLNAVNVQTLNIDQSDFIKTGFSCIKTKTTNIQIQNSTFSNRLNTDHRFLAQSINDGLNSAKLTQPIQFILLDSSNSTLVRTSFIENCLNTLVDGGVIQIIGSGGVHTLTDCIFENNQASNGGAFYAKGQATSISILNSQFDNNQANENGGALFFADQSVKGALLISKSTFYQNTATLGGAAYLRNQALIADFSTFIENNALKGGAIATMSPVNSLVDLQQSSFIRNNASEGAALIALNQMNFDYSTSLFKGNTAVSGGDVTSMPTSLRLKIYQFESYFLFINNTSAQDLLSFPTTVMIYDSAVSDPSESIALISGAQPNLLFEVTILDALGEKIGQTNNAQGKFKISSSSSSSNLVGMLGTTAFTYNNSMAYIFKAFSVKGPFDATVTLSIEGTYVSQTSDSIQSLPSLSFSIALIKCSVGQIYDKSLTICSSCSSSTYSLADPFTTQACKKCMNHAVCLGGSIMYPAQGYWRIDESSQNFIKCPQPDSCLGGSKDGGRNISLTGFCGEGYEGVACSSCTPGYAKFGSSQSCANCKESKVYYVMFGGYLLIQAIAIIFSVKMNLRDSLKKNLVVRSTLMKIVIDFLQILTLVSEFNFNFPKVVSSLYDSISKILPTNTDALSVDCFIALKKGNNHNVFFNKVLVILAEPFVYMLLAYIVWIIIFRMKKKSVSKNPDFKYNILLSIIVITYVLQPGVLKIMFELFNCKNYGSLEDPKYYLVYDVNVQCWKPEHLIWVLPIAIPTLIIGLLAPFGILAYWTRDKDLRAAQRVQKAYTFIFKPYKNKALFWELAILLRKATLIIISVFITSQYLQAYLGFFSLAVYYSALYKISPYNIPQLNFAEALSVGSSAFILYSGLYFVRVNEMDTVSYILFACDIICGIVFVIYIIYVFLKKNAPAIQRQITRIGSKILTSIHSRQTLQSPGSLQFNGPNDSPLSTDRIMSTERFASIERFMSAERFITSTENLMSTEGLMTTERCMTDRPFSPVISTISAQKIFLEKIFRIQSLDFLYSAKCFFREN